MDQDLSKWLEFAENRKAILLTEEADIFLQRPGKRLIQRNGHVSVFVRKAEYLRGMLFLTNNRAGSIDDAFSSRIYATIGYPKLDNLKRAKIWEAFFTKLAKDYGDKIYVASEVKKYVLGNDESTRGSGTAEKFVMLSRPLLRWRNMKLSKIVTYGGTVNRSPSRNNTSNR